jgi:ribosomal protein S7
MLFKQKNLTAKEKIKFNKNLFNQTFLKFLLKCGSKTTAKKNYKKFFSYICNEINFRQYSLIGLIKDKLHVSYELRNVKYRKRSNIVPFPLTRHRRFFLNIKWIFNSVKLDKRYIPLYKKLSTEVIKIVKNEDSYSKKTRDKIASSILKYKTNLHYRWY